tara:strand:- start:158 stop:556 length:399 start_codon:yes stop_codon:yes gene_type:complete
MGNERLNADIGSLLETGTEGHLLTASSSSSTLAEFEAKDISLPTVTGISPTSIDNDTATNVTITGTNFANGARVEYLASDGDIFQPNSVSFTSATQLVVNITEDTAGTYFLRVENPNGQAVRTGSAVLTVDS